MLHPAKSRLYTDCICCLMWDIKPSLSIIKMEPVAESPPRITFVEGLKNVPAHLSTITSYVARHPGQFQGIRPFSYTIDNEGGVDIVINGASGNIRLKDFLPRQISISQSDGVHSAYARQLWGGLYGELLSARVFMDIGWAHEHPAEGVSVLAHELGHAFITEHENLEEVPPIPENPKTATELERTIELSCQYISDSLEEEVKAWNFGKPIATLFGIDDLTYDDQMNYALKLNTELHYLHLKGKITEYTARFQNAQPGQFKTGKTFKLYDVSLQERIELTHDQLMKFLEQFSQEKVDRAFRALPGS